MNHRRALRASTDTGLAVFLIMIVGVVLWTTDELLDWNLLPDWIDKYAQLLVLILSILAAFAVVISIMCSFAVMAEAAAENAGFAAPTPSHRTRLIIGIGILATFGILFGLHKVDHYRAVKARQAEEREKQANHEMVQVGLANRTDDIVALFSPETRAYLNRAPLEEADAELVRLLNAIKDSTPFNPDVSILVPADEPYTHCILGAKSLPFDHDYASTKRQFYHQRRFLTDFPSAWERDVVAGLFAGTVHDLPRAQSGVFVDTRRPSAWGELKERDRVIGIVMLKGRR